MKPSPSVVVAETDTGAPPSAADSAASASARRAAKPRPVRLHLHRDVADAPARLAEQPEGAGEEDVGVGTGVLGVVGAEVRADVAEARRGEQRVDDGVGDGIAVGVARERGLARPFEAREPQRPVAAEGVDVGADARRGALRGAGIERRRPPAASGVVGDERARPVEVGGGRDLERERVAVDDGHGVPGGAHQRRVVGVVAIGGAIGGLEDVAAEALRSLRGGELVAVDGGHHLGVRRRA